MLNTLQPGEKWFIKICKYHLPALMLFFLVLTNAFAQKSSAFQQSTPEAQGVSAVGIDSFLTAVGQSKHEFHSIMILRHGKVITKGWWNPYQPQLKHSLYSLSKSFTSTAVGFAVAEKKLSVDDKVISFFPNSLPETVSPYLAQLKVKDLLSMSAGQEPDPTTRIPFTTDDWVKGFLATTIAWPHLCFRQLCKRLPAKRSLII
jgi:CubicO group peptidase (beta-lactamase class C family)